MVSYIIGFLLSIVLTIIPYTIIVGGLMARPGAILVAVAAALAQLWVQLYFFLHLDSKPQARNNLLAFVFTAIMVGILVGGSLWIMYNLDYLMMQDMHGEH